MFQSSLSESKPSQVTVRFGDGAHSFVLPKDATLHDLADRVHDLEMQHDGAPLEIHVAFTSKSSRPTMSQSSRQHVAS